MMIALALLVAQDAAAVLKKIEAAAEEAPSLLVNCTFEGKGPFGAYKGTGAVSFKKGNRVRATLRYELFAGPATLWCVSDGKAGLAGEPPLPTPAPARPAAGLVRAGATLLAQPQTGLSAGFDWGSLAPENLKLADGVLSYDLAVMDATYAVKLHYDAAAWRPTKREVAFKAGRHAGAYVETYTAWSPGAEIPDATFKLEAPKGP